MTFTYNGYKFEGRQSEAHNIVWLEGNPDDSERASRAFSFEEVADFFIVNRELPEFAEAFKQHIIIEEIDGELAIQILKSGYNIIERTLYNPELAQKIVNDIKKASEL